MKLCSGALPQTVSTIFSAMDVHGWLTFNEFVQIVEVRCRASLLPSCAVYELMFLVPPATSCLSV